MDFLSGSGGVANRSQLVLTRRDLREMTNSNPLLRCIQCCCDSRTTASAFIKIIMICLQRNFKNLLQQHQRFFGGISETFLVMAVEWLDIVPHRADWNPNI